MRSRAPWSIGRPRAFEDPSLGSFVDAPLPWAIVFGSESLPVAFRGGGRRDFRARMVLDKGKKYSRWLGLECAWRAGLDRSFQARGRRIESPSMGASGSKPVRRRRRVAWRLLIVVPMFLLGTEFSIRALLFGDLLQNTTLSARLRDPSKWANQLDDELYWKLQYLWSPPQRRRARANHPDPELGWRSRDVLPVTYAHREEGRIGNRRPVLLFGDSFAQGVLDPEDSFQALFEESDAAGEYTLLNYGVGGYGFGQICLMVEKAVDRFLDRKPVVIVSLLLDGDLDRSLFGFRCWPKPAFRVEDGRLQIVPPPCLDAETYLERYPPRAFSWLWRYLEHGRLLPGSWRSRIRREARSIRNKRRVNRALMGRVWAFLQERNVQACVLVFVGRGTIRPGGGGWREPFLLSCFRDLRIPYVIDRPDLREYARERQVAPRDLFILRGPGNGHYNRSGNVAALRTILRAIRKEYDGPEERMKAEASAK